MCSVVLLCSTLCEPVDCTLPGSSAHVIFSGKNTGVGCHFLLQGIFLTQGSNLGFPHCRQTLYHLNHSEAKESILQVYTVLCYVDSVMSNSLRPHGL